MGGNGGDTEGRGVPVSREHDGLPDDAEVLQDMLREARMQLGKVQLELDVRQATLETAKEGPGAEPGLLTNAEKAAMAEAPRAKHGLREVLPVAGMAKSGYEYARNARAEGEAKERAAARKAVIEASGAGGGTYGYRRVCAQASADAEDGAAIGERAVRGIMRDEGLVARAARKKRRCSSYEGEISEAPENLLRDERGRHHFHADKPNGLWITDVTEFRIPAGQGVPLAHRGLLRRHAAGLVDIDLARRRDGRLVAARRARAARRGRPSQDPLGPRLPLPLAGMDRDMR